MITDGLKIEFTRRWEGAHRFIEGDTRGTLCSQPHGHSWHVIAEVGVFTDFCLDQEINTIIPFASVKKVWHGWIDHVIDHSLMLNAHDPLLEFMLKDNPGGRYVVMPGDPTTEIVCITFMSKLNAFLLDIRADLYCEKITIKETPTNSISFKGDPAVHLPGAKDTRIFWWNRADMTSHDLEIEKRLRPAL